MESYKDSIFEPLEYYRDYGKATHQANVSEYFDDLVKKSGINVEQNKETVKKYREKQKLIDSMNKKLNGHKLLRTFSIIGAILLFIVSLIIAFSTESSALQIILPLSAIAIGVALIILAFKLTSKKIKALERKINNEELLAFGLRKEAEAQMAPLNALFSDDDTLRLIEKTLPQVKFDREFLFVNLEEAFFQ